jgi:hypothetical protein
MLHDPQGLEAFVDAFLLGFPALFSVVNPIGGAFVFQTMLDGGSPAQRATIARRVPVYSCCVLLSALWAGSIVMDFFGVTLAALRVAGGTVIALNAWQLLSRPARQEPSASVNGNNITFFPADHADHRWARQHLGRSGTQLGTSSYAERRWLVFRRHERGRGWCFDNNLVVLWCGRSGYAVAWRQRQSNSGTPDGIHALVHWGADSPDRCSGRSKSGCNDKGLSMRAPRDHRRLSRMTVVPCGGRQTSGCTCKADAIDVADEYP